MVGHGEDVVLGRFEQQCGSCSLWGSMDGRGSEAACPQDASLLADCWGPFIDFLKEMIFVVGRQVYGCLWSFSK